MTSTRPTPHLIIAIGLFGLLAFPGSLLAGEADHDSDLLALVSLIDNLPTRDHYEAVGLDNTAGALSAIALDDSLARYPRVRAMHALALFPSATSSELLERVALEEHQDVEVRIAAIAVLSEITPPEYAARHDHLVGQLMGDSEAEIQEAAVRAAGRLPAERGLPLLDRLDGLEGLAGDVRSLAERTRTQLTE